METMQVDSNIKKIELGMSKQQVISIMGKHYQAVGAYALPEGSVEILAYSNHENAVYNIHVLNDKVIRWEYEPVRTSPIHIYINIPINP